MEEEISIYNDPQINESCNKTQLASIIIDYNIIVQIFFILFL
jgi:hypothetical protein